LDAREVTIRSIIDAKQYPTTLWTRFFRTLGSFPCNLWPNLRGVWRLRTLLYGIGQPRWWLDIQRGYEDFDYPGTWHLLDILPQRPSIIHCHNLHGEYFDIRALPWLSNNTLCS